MSEVNVEVDKNDEIIITQQIPETNNKLQTQLNKFTDKFKSFSNDLFRTIELAHGIADLHNSKFAYATVAAAAAAAENDDDSDREKGKEINVENRKFDDDIQSAIIVESTNRTSISSNNSIYLSTLTLNNNNNVDLIRDERDFCVNKQQQTLNRTDSSTNIPDGIYISIWEVFIYLWGCIAFFIDIISDIILSVGYYSNNKKWFCALTLLFVIVPNLTLSLFSLSWYIDNYYSFKNKSKTKANNDETDIGNHRLNLEDSYDLNKNPNNSKKSTFNSITFWITTIIFLILQLDLVYKYLQGFFFTLKGWIYKACYKNDNWSKYYIEKQIKCDTDIGMLRLIDVFMDSGPQVLLQLYVITTQNLSNENDISNVEAFTWSAFLNQENRLVLKQVISIISSLFSMGYALAGYHRCLRNQQYLFCINKSKRLLKPISWYSTIMQFLWYLFLITPRVLSMALFASTFRSWFFMIIFIHWLIMYFWILNLKTNYCLTSTSSKDYNAREEIFEKFYNFVCSFIYIFAYFNLKSGNTRYRYLTYYIIFYLENILFSVSYYCFSNEKNTFFKLSMLLIILVGFWIAILFQIIYYLYFHPAQDIKLCVKIQDKFHFIYVSSLLKQQQQKSSSINHQIESKNKSSACIYKTKSNSLNGDSETTRSFKSISINYKTTPRESIESIVSSMYHSIHHKQQPSLYGSCITLKNENVDEELKKIKFDMLKIKETSL